MHAYSELYLEKAQAALGSMLHYAVYDLKIELSRFYRMFLDSGIAKGFGVGEPKYVVGRSGIELARDVIYSLTEAETYTEPVFVMDKTPEYWAGWALAYYEWYTGIPFDRIEQSVPISDVIKMYNPLHEADISRFVYAMDLRMDRISG